MNLYCLSTNRYQGLLFAGESGWRRRAGLETGDTAAWETCATRFNVRTFREELFPTIF